MKLLGIFIINDAFLVIVMLLSTTHICLTWHVCFVASLYIVFIFHSLILLIQFSSAFTNDWKALCHNYWLPASVPKILFMTRVICFINLVFESVSSWQGCSFLFFTLTFSCLYRWLHKSLLITWMYVFEKIIVRHESSYFAFMHYISFFFVTEWCLLVNHPHHLWHYAWAISPVTVSIIIIIIIIIIILNFKF
jgi:hypothetical protein